MSIDFLTPEIFDAIIIVNIVLGLLLAGRRFRKDLARPLPDDAPQLAREPLESADSAVDRALDPSRRNRT